MTVGLAPLDDLAAMGAGDPGGMLGLIGGLGGQLRAGFRLGREASALPAAEGLTAAIVCGMGGSGVIGDLVRSVFGPHLPVPLQVVKGYELPAWSARDTLVIAVSFSGNTEETLAAYGRALEANCRLVAISAGGELAARAEADDVPTISVPPDVPVPRAALGYLAGAAVGVLDAIGLVPPADDDVRQAGDLLDGLAGRLGPGVPAGENPAKSLAAWLVGRIPVVWGSEGVAEAAALRWKTQLNENAKVPAFASTLPELDHNEIEGWSEGSGAPFGLVVLRHPEEDPRVAGRVAATLEAIAPSGMEARTILAEGSGRLAVAMSLVAIGDFVSTYLAILRKVDPTPVPVLMGLKARLAR